MDLTEKIGLSQTIAEAYLLAFDAHAGQKRKTGGDYFKHPLDVAVIVLDNGGDDATIAASLLHDVVEDTPITLEEIRKKFGEEITFLVDGVTKKENGYETFKKIKEAYG